MIEYLQEIHLIYIHLFRYAKKDSIPNNNVYIAIDNNLYDNVIIHLVYL
jgi:hypothetical protein